MAKKGNLFNVNPERNILFREIRGNMRCASKQILLLIFQSGFKRDGCRKGRNLCTGPQLVIVVPVQLLLLYGFFG